MKELLPISHMKRHSYIYLLFLLTAIFFGEILFQPGKIAYSETSEIINYHSYTSFLKAETMQTFNEIPLWNPYTMIGNPFLSSSHSGLFYPFNAVVYIFPPQLYYIFVNASVFLHFFLAGFFMYLFMKKIGVNKFGAFIAGITFMFSGKLVTTFLYAGHFTNMPIVLLPLMLLLLELAIEKRSYLYANLLGISMAIQFFGVHTQLFYYSIVILFVYSVSRALRAFSNSLKKFLKLNSFYIIAVIVLVLITSVQLFPAVHFAVWHSARPLTGDYSFATSFSLPPKQFIAFLVPDFFGSPLNHTTWGAPNYWELNAYLGITSLFLALIAIIFRRNFYTVFFALLGIVAVLFSMGNYTPFFAIFSKIPGVTIFRIPSRMLYIYSLSVAVLAGIGAGYISSDIEKEKRESIKRLSKAIFALGIILLIFLPVIYFNKAKFLEFGKAIVMEKYHAGELPSVGPLAKQLSYYTQNVETVFNGIFWNLAIIIIGIIISSGILTLRLRRKEMQAIFMFVIALVILFELWGFGIKFVEAEDFSSVFAKNNIISFLEKDTSYYRAIDLTQETHGYIAGRYGVNILNFDVQPARYFMELMETVLNISQLTDANIKISDIKNYQVFDILNFKYFITKEAIINERFELVYNSSGSYIYLNKEAMPRAYIVHKVVNVNNGQALDILPTVELKSVAVVEDALKLNDAGKSEGAEIIFYSPNRVVVSAISASDGLLVFSDAWMQGWEVFVNGNKSILYKTNHALRGVFLKAGTNEVIFTYNPPYYKATRVISIVTIIVLCIYLFSIFWQHRKQRPQTEA